MLSTLFRKMAQFFSSSPTKNDIKYDDYVIRDILADNQFGITSVNDLKSLNYFYFFREEFSAIEKLIQSNNIKAIKGFSQNGVQTSKHSYMREYLDVMAFSDQNDKYYIVAVYDSDALEQDPQVIKIYGIK